MTEKKVRCDFCGKPALEVRYDFERVRDAAGGSDTEYKTKDLCAEHAMHALQRFLEQPSLSTCEEARKNFSEWMRGATWRPAQ